MNKNIITFFESANKTILGKNQEFKLALCCFLSEGHLLIEDVPGVGKTTFAKVMAKLLGLKFSRIQFTNDLMPSDMLGMNIFDAQSSLFRFIDGPIFNQFILADELNRGTPKTQSALLEAMEEKQVTIDGKTLKLPDPFFVVATQNPRSQTGTHNLPESQLDRFMMKIRLGYPEQNFEKILLSNNEHVDSYNKLICTIEHSDIVVIRNEIEKVLVSEKCIQYILELLNISRNSQRFQGLSPRAGKDIVRASKTWAYLCGRDFVLPDDIQAILASVISHRISTVPNQSFETEVLLTRELIQKTTVDE